MTESVQLAESCDARFDYQILTGQIPAIVNAAQISVPSDFIRRRVYVVLNQNASGPAAVCHMQADVVFELGGREVLVLQLEQEGIAGTGEQVIRYGLPGAGAGLPTEDSMFIGDFMIAGFTQVNVAPFKVNISADKVRIRVNREQGGNIWDLFIACHSESLVI